VNVNGEIDITFSVFRRMTLSWLGVRMLLLRLFAVAVLISATVIDVRDGTLGQWIRSLLISVVIFAIPELLVLGLWAYQRNRVAGPAQFVITGDGLSVQRAGGQEQIAWRDVARVRRGQYAWAVNPDGLHPPILVPRSAFSPEDRTAVNDFFLRHPEFAG
jgi:hypothetical protein